MQHIEFFVALTEEGDIDKAIFSIKQQVNEWLSVRKDIIIHKMFMSVVETYPIFWIWYEDTT